MRMNESKKQFGKRFSEVRKSKGLKQKDLQELLDVPTIQMISGWENGHTFPSAAYLMTIAEKLDISLEYLLLGKQPQDKPKQIRTYQEAAECIVLLIRSGLFSESLYLKDDYGRYGVSLTSDDSHIGKFVQGYRKLLEAKSMLKGDLFDIALHDALKEFDVSLKK